MGRSSLYLVVGFNLIFGILGFNLSRVSNEGYTNYVNYYNETQAHNIASSGTNVACNQLFQDGTWRAGYTNVPFAGGAYSVRVTDLAGQRIRLNAIGTHEGESAYISVLFGPSSFAKFAYYSVVEGGIYWGTGDTVWGPWHSETKLTVKGDPVFYGKTTTRIGLFKSPPTSDPKFYGGFESGVGVELPDDMDPLRNAAQSGGAYFHDTDVWLTFNSDATVSFRTTAGGSDSTVSLAAFAPNGTIVTYKGNLHVKGIVNGQVTIGALGSSGSGYGNVYLDDNIVYSVDPSSSSCTDLLGICAESNVVITENTENNSDIRIQGALFCLTGGFTAENYNSRPLSGTIFLTGGIQQYQREPVGKYTGSVLTNGFGKNIRYDDRLADLSPPYYPTTKNLEILSWYE
jgi:hypothetical protein